MRFCYLLTSGFRDAISLDPDALGFISLKLDPVSQDQQLIDNVSQNYAAHDKIGQHVSKGHYRTPIIISFMHKM